MHIDDHILDTECSQPFERNLQQRAAPDFHQGLWTCVRQGAQTGAEARGENHCFHLPWLSRLRWRTATSKPALPRKWFASCSAKYTDRCCPPVHPKETIRFLKPRLW